MNIQVAQIVFACIMGAAVIVWGISLRITLRFGERPGSGEDKNPWARQSESRQGPIRRSSDREEAISKATNEWESGCRTVRGSKESISKGIATALSGQSIPGSVHGLFAITERTSDRVAAEKQGPLICNQPPSMRFSEVEFDLRTVSDSTVEVSYRIGFGQLRQRVRKTALFLILGVGLPVIIGLGLLVWFLVASHPNVAVRWQVLQTLQVIHVLWPPFLVLYQYRSGRRYARTFVSNLLMTIEQGAQEVIAH